MAYDESLVARIRDELAPHGNVTERKMFGGLAFMVAGNVCCGVTGSDLMLRLGAEGADAALEDPHVRPMDFTGRPLSGFVYVAPEATAKAPDLRRWLGRALVFISTLPPKG
jgi:TfoX/Sxy family transcriptional regulator of competence genes